MAILSETAQIRAILGLSQAEFAKKYGIPKRTIEEWDRGTRKPPQYVIELLKRVVAEDSKEMERENKLSYEGYFEKGKKVKVTINGKTYERVVRSEMDYGAWGEKINAPYVYINNKKYYEGDFELRKENDA